MADATSLRPRMDSTNSQELQVRGHAGRSKVANSIVVVCCCFFWHPMYCSQSEFVQTCGGIPKEIEAVMIFYDGVPLRFHDSSGE